MAQCVDDTDFYVAEGVIHQRTHGARMLNDTSIREVPVTDKDPDQPEFGWIIPGFDTLDYTYGDAVTAQPGNGRFIVNKAGLYTIQAGIGDNEFEANDGASLYLTIYVGGASYARGGAIKKGGDKAWVQVADTIDIPAGATVRLQYSVRYCQETTPPDPPFCGGLNHFLYPDTRNHFTIHRVGGLNPGA